MMLRYLYILFIILTACNSRTDEKNSNPLFGQRTTFKASDLRVVATRAIKTLDNDDDHGVSFISNTGNPVSNDFISSLLYKISEQDIIDGDGFETYVRTCDNVDILTWKSITHKNVVTRIERIYLKATIPLGDGRKNAITVTDFDIYSINKPDHILLRVIDDYDLEYLKIDEVEYIRIAESIPVGIDLAVANMDRVKKSAGKSHCSLNQTWTSSQICFRQVKELGNMASWQRHFLFSRLHKRSTRILICIFNCELPIVETAFNL